MATYEEMLAAYNLANPTPQEGAVFQHNEAGSFWTGAPDATPQYYTVDKTSMTATPNWEPVPVGGFKDTDPYYTTMSMGDIQNYTKDYQVAGASNYGSNEPTQMLQNKYYTDYVSALPEWQQAFYKNTVPYYDTGLQNYGFKPNEDGTYSVIKTNFGGDYDYQVQQAMNDPIDTNWFKWTYDPKTGTTSNYEQYDAPGTTGMEYAPYFLAAGTLLTGGMLAPVMAGAGIAGGAAIGAGLGAASSLAGQMIPNQGQISDWGKVGLGALTGAAGGALAGGGGWGGIMDKINGSEFVMTPETAAAYGMEAYPSAWEGSIYGSQQGLMDATGSIAGWVSPWDTMRDAAQYSAEQAANGVDFGVEAVNYEPAPGEDALAEQATGMNMKELIKKVGLDAAKKLLGGQGSPVTQQVTTSTSSAPSAMSGLGGRAASLALNPTQQFLKYKLLNEMPEYWRFMDTNGEE